MKAMITRASESYFVEVKDFNTLEDLLKFIENEGENRVIIEKKWDWNDVDSLMRHWDGMTIDLAKEIIKCEYEVMIYDGYVE